MPITLRGGPELAIGLAALKDTREITAASSMAGRTIALAASQFVPNDSGELAGSIEVTEDERRVTVGSNSPYARWFHVPTLSEGNVGYAKKTSRRGRSYGQRIPDDPFLFNAVEESKDDVFEGFVTAVGDLIDRALS